MNYAIILAGGRGVRFQGNIPKQFVALDGVPLLVHSMRTAEACRYVDAICVVTQVSYHDRVRKWAEEYGITKLRFVAEAGKERQQSVYSGLKCIPAKQRDTALIMTAVCPFVSQRTMSAHYGLIEHHEGSITVVKATDAVTFSADGKSVGRTMQKKFLYIQQGPQLYRYGAIMAGHKAYMQDASYRQMDVTEDSELVLNMGIECGMVIGDRFCIKVTYPEDLAIAEALHPLFADQEMLLAQESE